jgi:hypothetical protein
LTVSSPAQADFHQMKIREVDAGTAADANAEFVELQMYSDGQHLVGGHVLKLYQVGSVMDCDIPSSVAPSVSQDTILFATTQSGLEADFTFDPFLVGSAGAVCFEGIDCVSWGTFSGSTTSDAAPAFAGPIPDTQSIDRRTDIAEGPTTLEAADDTNSSSNDFQAETPSPTHNDDPADPEAMTCEPGGTSVQNLRTRVRGNRATITGRIDPPAPGDTVKLTFFAKRLRFRKVATKFDQLDLESRFMKRFRVPANATRCMVKVAFHGVLEATNRFAC